MKIHHRIGPIISLALFSGGTVLSSADSPATGKIAPAAIHSVAYSHQDLGYANYPHILRTENRLENIFRSVRYAEQTKNWPDASKYRFQQEGAEPFPYFLSQCTPAEREQLAVYMKEGRIAVGANLTTVLTDRLNPESAARLFYLANRHLPDLLGTPPGKVAIINDVTGVSWSMPIYCQAAGVPFLSNGHNTCGKMNELESAPIVRWNGPAGTGEVLAFSSVYNYHAVSNPKSQLPGRALMDGKRITPGFIPVWLQGHDFSITNLSMSSAAKEWNDQGGKPEVRMSTLEIYLNALAKRQTPEKTPTVSKTGPAQWMDQPISDAWLFGRVRQASERLPMAEKFASFAMTSAGAAYPWFDFTTAWHNLLSNYEHTVGAACWRGKDAAGWRHYETEHVEHREEGLMVKATADRTLDRALGGIASRIPSPAGSIVVFNPLSRPRTDVVCAQFKAKSLTDKVTGETVPIQQLPDGTSIFVATNVPAMGYKVFSPSASSPSVKSLAPSQIVETAFYKLTVNAKTGAVTGLFDKELNRELIKKDATHAFNQYLHEWYPEATGKSSWSQAPTNAEVKIENGPVAAVMRIRSKAEGVNWLEQTLCLYHAVKRIDFSIRLDKKPSGRSLNDYFVNNLKGKESVFVALPFDMPNFKAVYQTGGGGVAEPVKDSFTGVCTAFQAVQHFTDISNDQFGITISPIDCSLVEFGYPRSDALVRSASRTNSEMHYEQKMEYPKDSAIYMYLMDNMFTTNIRIDQRGEHLFRWSLRSHAGDWQAGKAAQFGEGVNQPLQARVISSAQPEMRNALPAGAFSFVSVDTDNVSVTACKLAENNGDGFIVRLVETCGHSTSATLSLPFLGDSVTATATNLVENDLEGKPITVAGNTIKLDLPPYGVKTLRVRAASAPVCEEVRNLAVVPLSDLEISLKWDSVPGAAFYRVHRSTDADFTPSALTLVATVAEPEYHDQARDHIHGWITNRLHPETVYQYRVEAVSRNNQRSHASAATSGKTLATAEKACPPQAVRDLHAILVSPIAPANQISLLWRSNIEPTVCGYEVYRSTVAGFTPSQETLLAKLPLVLSAKGCEGNQYLDHQMYLDARPDLSTTYYYRVRAVTKSGLAGDFSNEASATSKSVAENVGTPAKQPAGNALLGNDVAPR